MPNKSLVDDIDYLRTLAEAGEQSPLLGGRFYMLWGTLMGLAYSGHYLLITGTIGSPTWLAVMWPTVITAGLLGQTLMVRSLNKNSPPGFGSAGNQTSMYVWQYAGIAMFALFVGLIGRIMMGIGSPLEIDWSVPVVFALYSVALGTSGAMAGNTILKVTSWIAATVFAGALMLIGQPEVYLLGSTGMILSAVVPGFLLLRAEPSQTV